MKDTKMPLSHALPRWAAQTPDKTAVNIAGHPLTFSQLLEGSTAVAQALTALPRKRRGHVQDRPVFGILTGNHGQVSVLITAALAHDTCMMMLEPQLPTDQLLQILTQMPPDVVFVTNETEGALKAWDGPRVNVDDPAAWTAFLAKGQAITLTPPDQGDPFLIAFTSGTTSMPKGFSRNRASWQASMASGRDHFGITSDLTTFAPGPLSHGLSLYAFAETVEAGACFAAPAKYAAGKVGQGIADRKAKRLVCVPSILEDFSGEPTPANLTQITTAGAKLADDLTKRLHAKAPQAAITEYYGASELGFVTTRNALQQSDASSVGTPFPGVDLRIDPESDLVWVRSAQVIDGYLTGLDGHGLQRDGDWATVGDLGALDATGALILWGRAGGMLISGGKNIFPQEVETALQSHPDVAKVCVTGVADQRLGTRLVAVLCLRDGAQDIDSMMENLSNALPRYKIPRQFYLCDAMPMTASGKIATRVLDQMIADQDPQLKPLILRPSS